MSSHEWRLSAADLEAIERVCDEFENGWRRASQDSECPRLEEYAARFDESLCLAGLTELVILDAAYRQQWRHQSVTPSTSSPAGKPNPDETDPTHPTWTDYVQRFPQLEQIPIPAEFKKNQPQNTLIDDRFQVIRRHASGGLGHVNVARDKQLGRDVAVKEMQARFVNQEEYRNRFLREAEITGRLEHPSIVPVYAMGVDEHGEPYYAMRLIQGKSLLAAIDDLPSDASPLERRQLIRRFLDVCQAVDYAHSQGVIHRDIKPDNIMLGDFGETFLVDWGLAKKIDEPEGENDVSATGSDSQTRYGVAMGTPAYMSPEQAAGELHRVDHRSDVYSLGATLLHLVSGSPPLSLDQRRGSQLSEHQNYVPAAWLAICKHAMETDLIDRYHSVGLLIQDIECTLSDQPNAVFADPWQTRARRFVQQHQTASVTAVLSICLICIGLVAYSWVTKNHATATARHAAQLKGKNKQLDESVQRETSARKAAESSQKQMTDAMESLFKSIRSADPAHHGRDFRVVDALDSFVEEFESMKNLDPGVRANIRLGLAGVYFNLAMYEKSRRFAEEAHEFFRQTFGETNENTFDAELNLARTLARLGDTDARSVLQHVLQVAFDAYPDDDPRRLRAERVAAVFEWQAGNPRDALGKMRGLETRFRQAYADDSGEMLAFYDDLAAVEAANGNIDEALRISKEVYQSIREKNGPESLLTITAGSNYTAHLLKAAKNETARVELEALLGQARKSLGDDHYFTLILINRLGDTYLKNRQTEKGIPLIEEALRRSERIYGATHQRTLVAANSLGGVYLQQGDYPKAIQQYARVYGDWITTRGPDHPETLTVGNNLATAYGLNQQYDEAIEVYKPTLEAQTRKLGRQHLKTIRTMFNMALILQKASRVEESMPYCVEAAELAGQHLGADHPFRQTSLSICGMGYLALGEYEQAKDAMQDCFDSRSKTMPDHWLRFHTMSVLGETYFRCGEVDKADQLLNDAYQGMREREDKLPPQGKAYYWQAKDRLKLLANEEAS